MRIPLLNESGLVVNVVIAGDGWTPPDGLTAGPEGGEMGWTWENGQWNKPEPPSPPPDEPTIAVVTPRQAKLALLGAGLLEQVEAAIAAADKATQITWESAIEFRRDDPLINSLGKGLGLTDEQIDQLFATASTL